jgi:hypothetical protein
LRAARSNSTGYAEFQGRPQAGLRRAGWTDADGCNTSAGGFYQPHPDIRLHADIVRFREEQLLAGVNKGVAAVMEIAAVN